jgi:hypothetical protein
MVLSSDIQGMGISKSLMKKGLELLNGDIITLRTRNPRMYQSLVDSVYSYGNYPNIGEIPNEIYELALTIPYFKGIQSDLIIRNCYSKELIQQESKLNDYIFKSLNPNDAYGCISIINDNTEKLKKLIKLREKR